MNNTLLVYPFALNPSTMLRTGLSKGCSHHDEASTSSARTGLHKAPHYLLAALITLTLSALASIAHADNRPTTAENLATIERLQRSLQQREFSRTGNPYALAKVGAWLDFALDEYYEPDRSGIVQDATDEAAVILAQLDAQPGFDASATRQPYASERVRDDLWQQVATMKQHPDFACASEKIAELEVQLVWTGHEKWEAGWSQAEPYARIAENLAVEAQHQLDACALKHAPTPPRIVVEQRSLGTDALFAFGRAGIDDLAPGGRLKLDALAYDKYPALTEAEIKALVVDDKWLAAIAAAIHGEMDRISQTLTRRVKELAERYETPLPQLEQKVKNLAVKVEAHLAKMGFKV